MAPKEAVIDVVSDEMATARELEFAGDSDGELVSVAEYDDELTAMWSDLDEVSNAIPPKLPTRPWHFKVDAFLYRLERIKAAKCTDVFDVANCRKHYKLLKDEGTKLLREVDEVHDEVHDDLSQETLIMGEEPAPKASIAASTSSARAGEDFPNPQVVKKRPASNQLGPPTQTSTDEPSRLTRTRSRRHHDPVFEL